MLCVGCSKQLVDLASRSEGAVKDEANGVKFAQFIGAERKSLTAFAAQATPTDCEDKTR